MSDSHESTPHSEDLSRTRLEESGRPGGQSQLHVTLWPGVMRLNSGKCRPHLTVLGRQKQQQQQQQQKNKHYVHLIKREGVVNFLVVSVFKDASAYVYISNLNVN